METTEFRAMTSIWAPRLSSCSKNWILICVLLNSKGDLFYLRKDVNYSKQLLVTYGTHSKIKTICLPARLPLSPAAHFWSATDLFVSLLHPAHLAIAAYNSREPVRCRHL